MGTISCVIEDVTDSVVANADDVNEIYSSATGNEPRFNSFGADVFQPNYRAYVFRLQDKAVGFLYGFDLVAKTRHWFPLHASLFVPEKQLHNTSLLAEFHVHPSFQGRGFGYSLLTTWLGSTTLPTVLSTIDDPSTKAMNLYLRNGFNPIASGVQFIGDPRPFALLKRELD